MGDAPLGVERAVDRVDDHPHAVVAVVDLASLLGQGEEAKALVAQAVELGEHEVLGRVVDDQRAVPAAAPGAGLLGPFGRARGGGQHLLQASHGATARAEPVGVERGSNCRSSKTYAVRRGSHPG